MSVKKEYTAFAYVFEGSGFFEPGQSESTDSQTLVLYDDGENISITTSNEGVRFLFISGKPLKEPIAWRGPIVMNTNEELRTAFDEYRKGTFLKTTEE